MNGCKLKGLKRALRWAILRKDISYSLVDIPHIRICLLKRFVTFLGKLKTSNKPQVVHLFQLQKSDCRSTFGLNCFNLCREMNVEGVEDINIKNISMPIKTEAQNSWRVPFLKELLSLREGSYESGLSNIEINDIITYICCDWVGLYIYFSCVVCVIY